MNYQTFLKQQMQRARNAHLESEAIRILVLELSGYDGATFVANLGTELPVEEEKRLTEAIDKYIINKLPIQHIIGYSYFYGYKIIVNNEVLIPRPETEELVGYVLSYYDDIFNGKEINVVDVGTGSGAIAIALAKEEANMHVYGTDISVEALNNATKSALLNDASIKFIAGDMLQPLIENNLKFDILVSNPPYIPDHEYVEDIVKNNEPHIALFGGNDGMYFYDIILKDAQKVLNTPSILAFEHGYLAKDKMITLANKYFSKGEVISIKDLNGKDRMTIIINRG